MTPRRQLPSVGAASTTMVARVALQGREGKMVAGGKGQEPVEEMSGVPSAERGAPTLQTERPLDLRKSSR